MSAELIPWLAALFFLLGVIGLVLEIFIVPGFGVSGVMGILLLMWGFFLLAVDVTQATQAVVIALLATIVLFFIGIKAANRLMLWQRLSLKSRQNKEEGYLAARPDLNTYLGKTGTVVTHLRPAGTVFIDGVRLDVVSEGGYIPKDAQVEVVMVEGSRVVVRQAGNV